MFQYVLLPSIHLYPYFRLRCEMFADVLTPPYRDVIMSAMASQTTGISILYSTVCSGGDKNTSKLCVTGLFEGNSPLTGEFPAQRASNAENVSIWWRHPAQFYKDIENQHSDSNETSVTSDTDMHRVLTMPNMRFRGWPFHRWDRSILAIIFYLLWFRCTKVWCL